MEIKELKVKEIYTEIKIGEQIIKVCQYLPTIKKIKIIEAIVELCVDDEFVNYAKIDALFNVFLALNYTEIELNDRDLNSLFNLYDYLESNNYMGLIIQTIPKVEYSALMEYLKEAINDFNKFRVSGMGTIQGLVKAMPVLMEQIKEISKEINIEDFNILKEISSKYK